MYLCDYCKLLKEINNLLINSYPLCYILIVAKTYLFTLFLNINANESNTCKFLENQNYNFP